MGFEEDLCIVKKIRPGQNDRTKFRQAVIMKEKWLSKSFDFKRIFDFDINLDRDDAFDLETPFFEAGKKLHARVRKRRGKQECIDAKAHGLI